MAIALRSAGAYIVVLTSEGPPNFVPKDRHDDSRIWQSIAECRHLVEAPLNREKVRSLRMGLKYRTLTWARWVDGVVQHAKVLHSQRSFDVVYSRSLPAIAHTAGYWCSGALRLPWIANINDPWDLHLFPGRAVAKSLSETVASNYWLRKTIRNADAVTYPSQRLSDFHARIAGIQHEHKSHIIPHVGGYPEQNAAAPVSGFVLVHAGRLGMNELTSRPVKGLLNGLARFLALHSDARSVTRLVLVGPEDQEALAKARELGLDSIVSSTGRVSYQDSLKFIGSAAACVLVEAEMTEGIYLPSKLAEYVSARKPVLALSPRVGTVADMASDKGIIRVDLLDEEAVSGALARLYWAYRSGPLREYAPSEELVTRFKPETVAKKFLAVVDQVLRQRARKVLKTPSPKPLTVMS